MVKKIFIATAVVIVAAFAGGLIYEWAERQKRLSSEWDENIESLETILYSLKRRNEE